jgi:hypothetical protein
VRNKPHHLAPLLMHIAHEPISRGRAIDSSDKSGPDADLTRRGLDSLSAVDKQDGCSVELAASPGS